MVCISSEIEVWRRGWLSIEEVCDVLESNDDLILCFWEEVNLQFSVEVLDLCSDAFLVEFISLACATSIVSILIEFSGKEIHDRVINFQLSLSLE